MEAAVAKDFTVDEAVLSEEGIVLYSEWYSTKTNKRLVVVNRYTNTSTWRVEFIHFLVLGSEIASKRIVTAAEFLEYVQTKRFIKGGK